VGSRAAPLSTDSFSCWGAWCSGRGCWFSSASSCPSLGWKLLSQEDWSDHGSAGVTANGGRKVGSFYPLTMPLTVGPGSMSVAITISSRTPEDGTHVTVLALHAIGALLGLFAIAASIYLAYRFAQDIGRFLGATGLEVLVRLSAFILMCIGIEIIWNGFSALTTVH
jgi:multiple antibiotic resistance protein